MLVELKKRKRLSTSLCYGILGINYAIYFANLSTGDYSRILQVIENKHIQLAEQRLENLENKLNIFESDYDIIDGISGNVIYFLSNYSEQQIKSNKRMQLFIERSLNYLVNISVQPKSTAVIHQNEMVNNVLKEKYPDGYVNLSISHGLGGVVYALNSAKNKNIFVPRQNLAIQNILALYTNTFEICRSPLRWFARFVKNYNLTVNINYRNSWCYGIIGVLKVINEIAIENRNYQLSSLSEEFIVGVYNESISKYSIDTPTICHGYSGILLISKSITLENEPQLKTNFCNRIEEKILEYANVKTPFVFYDYDFINNGKVYETKKNFKDMSILNGNLGVFMSLLYEPNNNSLKNFFKMFCI